MVIENSRILIVDDDPGIRKTFERILSPQKAFMPLHMVTGIFDKIDNGDVPSPVKTNGFQVFLCEAGEPALKVVKNASQKGEPFAVSFIDMKMPGLNGAETAREIWKIDPDIKIVIVTAYSDISPDEIVEVAGRDDILYLRKPFSLEEIRQFARSLTYQWNIEKKLIQMKERLAEANKKLKETNRNLEAEVIRRTNQLIHSEKMSSLGILAAGIAHEINNPISYINNNMVSLQKYTSRISRLLNLYENLEELIEKKAISSEAVACIKEIRQYKEKNKIDFIMEDIGNLTSESLDGAARIQTIVHDLNGYARFSLEEFEEASVENLVDTALNLIASEVKHKARVVKKYAKLPRINCVPQRIMQVIVNILLNAVQAIDGEKKGVIRIETRLKEGEANGENKKVEIEISDNGKGIAERNLSKIFDPFFTTKPPGNGTGLGLSIAYEIVKGHKGTIEVKSKENVGSIFTIVLPVK